MVRWWLTHDLWTLSRRSVGESSVTQDAHDEVKCTQDTHAWKGWGLHDWSKASWNWNHNLDKLSWFRLKCVRNFQYIHTHTHMIIWVKTEMASLRPAIDQTSENTTQTANQHTATRLFRKWGPLIFCRARTWGYPAAWRKKWTPASSITLAASCAAKKRWRNKAGNKWQSESITWKRIMSPVKSTLCSMSSRVVEIGFWKPYILLTPFKPHQFEVSSSALVRCCRNPINSLLMTSAVVLIWH